MSTLSVTTISTANGTTDATISTGNTSAGKVVIQSGGGLTLASNSSVNNMVFYSSGGGLISQGFNSTPYNIGTVSSGTTTPSGLNGNYQYYTNNGAHTLAAPISDTAIDILITNGASAGSITFSGFTVSSSVGDPLTTTNTNKFIISIRCINSVSTYVIKALQ